MSANNQVFSIAICTIFAREFMEAAILVGNFRTIILRSALPDDDDAVAALRLEAERNSDEAEEREGEQIVPIEPNADDVEEKNGEQNANDAAGSEQPETVLTKKRLLKCVTCSALFAGLAALAVVITVAIPLAVLARGFDPEVGDMIEGISKIIASFCILFLSLKVPKWLGFYKTKKASKIDDSIDLTIRNIRFNVAWNVWREVAECGAFLLPTFLSGYEIGAIPISCLVGLTLGFGVGYFIYYANNHFENKFWVALFLTLVLVFVSVGLIIGAIDEFEEIYGSTYVVWTIPNPFWDDEKLPMTLLTPFGYTSDRSVVKICVFWLWLLTAACLHGYLIYRTRQINRELAEAAAHEGASFSDVDKPSPEASTTDLEKSPSRGEMTEKEEFSSTMKEETLAETY